MASFAVPLITGIAGGIFGRAGAKQRTAEEKTSINDILGANQLAFRRAEGLGPIAQDFLSTGRQTYQPSIDYWSKLLSGDRQAMSEAIGPETTRIAQNYEGAKTAATQFAPMGGGRSQMLSELPFRRGQDISALLSALRPEAAKQLSSIAQQLSAVGLDAEQVINSILSGIGDRGASLLDYGMDERKFVAGQTAGAAAGGSAIGKQLYEAIQQMGKKG